MYANMRRYKMDPASVDELKRRVEEGFISIVGDVPGFLAYYFVRAGEGEIVSINIFEDQAGAEKSAGEAADWMEENFPFLVPAGPEITSGEVIMHVHKLG